MQNEINTPAVEESTQAAAQSITPNQNDTIDNSVQGNSNEISATQDDHPRGDVPPNDPPPAVDSINSEVVAKLHHMLAKATSSAFYMSNTKRVEALEAALNIPVSDDKSFQQFFNHAEKDLVAESYKKARKDGGTPAEVTNAHIMAEAQRRYLAKHDKHAIVNEEYMG